MAQSAAAAGVLSFDESQYQEKSRKLISLVNQLRDAGAQVGSAAFEHKQIQNQRTDSELGRCPNICLLQTVRDAQLLFVDDCKCWKCKPAYTTILTTIVAACGWCWLLQFSLDLPSLVVCGNQSAGKSSLLERLCGVKLPRAAGTCTKCPTEVSPPVHVVGTCKHEGYRCSCWDNMSHNKVILRDLPLVLELDTSKCELRSFLDQVSTRKKMPY